MPRPTDQARAAAQKSGARLYASSRPCIRGHIGERYTSTGACRQCVAKQARPDRPGRCVAVDPVAEVLG